MRMRAAIRTPKALEEPAQSSPLITESGVEGTAVKRFLLLHRRMCHPWVQHWTRAAKTGNTCSWHKVSEGKGDPWIEFQHTWTWANFCLFVSNATGISWLITVSLELNSSFSCTLCCPPNRQLWAFVFIHAFTYKTELAKKGVTGAQHLLWPRTLFVISVSPVNDCSISLWASLFLHANIKSISIYSAVLYAVQLPRCEERRLWSAPFVYIIALVSGQLLGQRLMFFIYSLSTFIWIFLCLLP